jgi:hypothetical protein
MGGLILFFAIMMCLVNAVLWTLVTKLPFASLLWLVAAIGCYKLQKWSKR